MTNQDKTKTQLIEELKETRQRLAAVERKLEPRTVDEKTLRALVESASDGFLIVGPDGRITYANARAGQMFGYPPDELLGESIELLLPERLRGVHEQHRGQFLTQPQARPMGSGLELVGRRRDGAQLPVEVSLSYIEAESQTLILCVVADITQRKRDAETFQRTLEILQKRNRDLALLNQAGQTLSAILDPQEVVNRLLQAVTETIGAESSSVWLRDPDEPDWLVCQAALDHGTSRPLVNLRLPPGHGVAGWVVEHGESAIVHRAPTDPRFATEVDDQIGFQTSSLLAVPLQVRQKTIGVLEVVNKLTGDFDEEDQALVETLAASAAIAIENARLVEALRQHTHELERRNEELDAFAHTVAHDLKNPLGLMIGFAQALEENHGAISAQELQRHLRTITRNGRKLRNIINELLLLSGIRKTEPQMQPLDMAHIVAEAQERLVMLIEEHQAEIILPETWPIALGHDAWVEEVWANYLSNAIKYGGEPPRVELGATPLTNGSLRFWVKDNGPGLSSEDQARLFTPFTQLHSVRAQGHGLGLSIVRRIVEKLGGKVGVESEPGRGSLFYFTLPCARAEIEPSV